MKGKSRRPLGPLLGLLMAAVTCLWPMGNVWCERGEDFWSRLKGRFKDPLTIRARKMTLLRGAQRSIYEGMVQVVQKQYRLRCDRLEMLWDEESKRIIKILASGNVVMEFKDGKVTSEEASLDLISRKIFLSGSPQLIRGDERVSGYIIIHDLDGEKSTVLSGPGTRVRTQLRP